MRDIIRNPNPTAAEEQEVIDISTKLYNNYLTLDTDQILDNYSCIYIRTVAIMAGMQEVTELYPKRITSTFVDKVKELIKSKQSVF